MEKKNEQLHADQWLRDVDREPQIKGFEAEAMILCDKCGRKSPPTRLKCFYCGAGLQISAEQSIHFRPGLRKLEDWEKGFNLILEPGKAPGDATKFAEIADLLHLEKEGVQKIFSVQLPLPLARAESKPEAEFLVGKLEELSVRCRVISDEQLEMAKSPKRLRGLEFLDDRLNFVLFNNDEVAEIPYGKINLVVVGGVFERKIESIESMKKKDDRKVLDLAEMSNDEILVDVYTAEDPVGFRIESKGFDFSCLRSEKTLFAKENMPKLVEKLRARLQKARFSDNYLRIREELSTVWEVSCRNESLGLQRSLGRLSRTSVTTISNLQQFTKYSRLQWHIR